MGPNFLTQPDPNRMHFCSSALIISNVDYLLFCMHVKINMNVRNKSEHGIKYYIRPKLSFVTRGSLEISHPHRTSSTAFTLFVDCRDLMSVTVI